MRKIEECFGKDGFKYELIKRDDALALYSVKSGKTDIYGYEVHKIRAKPEITRTLRGKDIVYPVREIIASTEEFGYYGWFYGKLDNANKKYDEVLNGQK